MCRQIYNTCSWIQDNEDFVSIQIPDRLYFNKRQYHMFKLISSKFLLQNINYINCIILLFMCNSFVLIERWKQNNCTVEMSALTVSATAVQKWAYQKTPLNKDILQNQIMYINVHYCSTIFKLQKTANTIN
jgi:hypothetical protein